MAVKDRLQEVKDCIAHAQSSHISISSFFSWVNPADIGNVSFFSFSCGLSNGMTQIMNLTKFYIIFYLHKQTHGQKRKIRPEIGLTSIFEWLLINLNSPPLHASLCQIPDFPPT